MSRCNINKTNLIPDYKDKTKSLLPVIVETPSSFHCIDGWELIEESMTKNESEVKCHIYTLSHISEIELAIRKVVIRTLPKGGCATYPERVRNVSLLLHFLTESKENPLIYSHGGARRGEDFVNNREENIRMVLADRLGRAVKTISKYLNHAEYLDEKTFNHLIELEADKKFFEKAQKIKIIIIKNLKHQGESEESITNTVSDAMRKMFEEYLKTGSIKIEEEDNDTQEELVKDRPKQDLPKVFKHWAGNGDSHEDTKTKEVIDNKLIEIGSKLIEYAKDSKISLAQYVESIKREISELLITYQNLLTMLNTSGNLAP